MNADSPLAAAEAALTRIPGLAGSRVLSPLGSGLTNASFLVQHGNERWVLRLDTPQALELGLDRASERKICAAVAAAGLAPAYRWFDAATGVCLRPWVDGGSLTPKDLQDAGLLRCLAARLQRLHSVQPVGRRFDPLAAARRYAAELGTAEAARRAEQAAGALAKVDPEAVRPALCHNDLVAENILRLPASNSYELLLIDWEYAGVGDPYFDLAVVVRHHALGEALAQTFLDAYLDRPATMTEQDRLAAWCAFYGHLLTLWNLRISV